MTWKGLLALAAGLTAGLALTVATGCGHGSAPAPSYRGVRSGRSFRSGLFEQGGLPRLPRCRRRRRSFCTGRTRRERIHRQGLGDEHGFRFDRRSAERSRAACCATTSSIFRARCEWPGRNPILPSTTTSRRWPMRPWSGCIQRPTSTFLDWPRTGKFRRTR